MDDVNGNGTFEYNVDTTSFITLYMDSSNITFTTVILNSTSQPRLNTNNASGVFESKIIVPLYIIIFLLSIIGNFSVLVTLLRNKRMRTVTNVYLLNLALSDLLLGVFCIPFTLVGQVLRTFIFGAVMCKLIPYFQVVAVSVGVWTLVAISLERYFAICRPLKSRRWQTQFHAYKMIIMVWLGSLCWSAPVFFVSSLKSMKGKGYKCREEWPTKRSEQAYNLFLDGMLLLIPLIFMILAYSLIVNKLWKGLKKEIQHNSSYQQHNIDRSNSSPNMNYFVNKNNNSTANLLSASSTTSLKQHRLAIPTTRKHDVKIKTCSKKSKAVKIWIMKSLQVKIPKENKKYEKCGKTKTTILPRCELTPCKDQPNSIATCSSEEYGGDEITYTFSRHAIRSNYMDKSIEAKKKVIRMLFVVVAEFFICWAPLHILNTWYLFYPEAVYKYVGSTGVSLVQLLAYISSCCNPITYCFMNRKFRQAFLNIFNCINPCLYCLQMSRNISTESCKKQTSGVVKIIQNNSDVSGNDSTVYVGRASTIVRSEIMVLEAEDRV